MPAAAKVVTRTDLGKKVSKAVPPIASTVKTVAGVFLNRIERYVATEASPPESPDGTYLITDYGAVGDNVTDDTLAIRAAVEAAETWAQANPGLQGVVEVPDGTFAISVQPGDDWWVNRANYGWQPWAIPINHSRITIRGNGPTQSIISVKTIANDGVTTVADPVTNWLDISGEAPGVQDVMRCGGFALRAPVSNIRWEGIRITGNCPGTGNDTEGGNAATGDGWDWSHKGIMLSAFPSTQIYMDNGQVDQFKGELIHGGGDVLGRMTITNSHFEQCNGSALSMPSLTLEDSTIKWAYNGVENFSRQALHSTIIRRVTITSDPGRAYGEKNGIVFIGGPDASALIEDVNIDGYRIGVLLAETAENVTITNPNFTNLITGVHFLMMGYFTVVGGFLLFRNFTLQGGSIQTSGSASSGLLIQACNGSGDHLYDNFLVDGVTFNGTGFRIENPAGPGTFSNGIVRNNTFNAGTADIVSNAQDSEGMLWTNNTYNGPEPYGEHNSSDYFGTGSFEIFPWSGRYFVDNLGNDDAIAYIDPARLHLYKDGQEIELVVPNRGKRTIFEAGSWNSFPADQSVEKGSSLTIRKQGSTMVLV